MKAKKLLVMLTISIIALGIIAPVNAVAEVWDSTEIGTLTSWANWQRAVNNGSAVGAGITPGNETYLVRAEFYLRYVTNTLTGTLTAVLYEDQTIAQVPGEGETTALEVSTTTLDVSTLSSDPELYSFDFAQTTLLESEHTYTLALVVTSPCNGSVYVGYTSTGAARAAEREASASGWTRSQGCFIHYFYSDVATAGGETPAPTTSPTVPTALEDLYTEIANFLVPVIVMLVPAMLMWWLGGRGKWSLLIGLAIGTALGYVFIAGFPLWLVFLVAIGIIGMAYSDVSGGGAYT